MMARHLSLPDDAKLAARALRLDAAIKAAGMDLRELGDRIGLKNSGARTQWRQGGSPQVDRWEAAAEALGVDIDWLQKGVGTPPKRVADCHAWILADPDLPPGIGRAGKAMFSRRIKPSTDDLLRQAAKDTASLPV